MERKVSYFGRKESLSLHIQLLKDKELDIKTAGYIESKTSDVYTKFVGQYVVINPMLLKSGFKLKLQFDWRHPGLIND